VLRATEETETTQQNIQDWLQLDEGDTGFQLLTEEEISADVIMDSAMEEESDNELDELQESIPFICFLSLFCPLRLSFALLIWNIA
jgi:hypothetical protein